MIAAVKWINYRNKEEPALIIEGEKFANAVMMDFPIHVYTLGKAEAAKLRPVLRGGNPYPVERNIKQFLEDSNSHGITPGAKRIMLEVLEGKTNIQDCRPSENQASTEATQRALTRSPVVVDESPPAKVIRAAPTGRVLYSTDKPIPDSPPASKSSRSERKAVQGGGGRGSVVQQLAERLGIPGSEVRKQLRKVGMRQPYGSLDECLAVMGK